MIKLCVFEVEEKSAEFLEWKWNFWLVLEKMVFDLIFELVMMNQWIRIALHMHMVNGIHKNGYWLYLNPLGPKGGLKELTRTSASAWIKNGLRGEGNLCVLYMFLKYSWMWALIISDICMCEIHVNWWLWTWDAPAWWLTCL